MSTQEPYFSIMPKKFPFENGNFQIVTMANESFFGRNKSNSESTH